MATLGRYLIAVLISGVLTAGLFGGLRLLINVRAEVDDSLALSKVEFVRLRREVEIEEKKREKPKKLEKQEEQPQLPAINLSVAPKPGQEALAIAAPTGDFDLNLGGGLGTAALGAPSSDSDIIPLVRVLPQYPPQALSRGTEGWVIVEFTISAAGTVKDPVVIDSHPSDIFNRAMLRAIRKWKYKPKVVNGVPVERPGVRVRQNFAMEEP